MMRKIFTIIILLAFNFYYSQDDSYGFKKIPTPDVANLGKFLETEVSLNKGIPSIDVPLYSIKVDEVELPISISYHAGGIRTDEISSSIGLGWKFSCEAMITRQKRGNPDELYFFGKHTVDDFRNSSQNEKINSISEDLGGMKDHQADVFSFNTITKSGKFYFDQNSQKFNTNIKEAIKITFNYNENKWIINDENGTTYIFESTDTNIITVNNQLTEGDQNDQIYDKWKLTKIITSKGNQISFKYDLVQTLVIYQEPVSQKKITLMNTLVDIPIPTCWNVSSNIESVKTYRQQNNESISGLTEVIFPEGKIKLVYSNDYRLDFFHTKNIKELQIIDNKNDLYIKYLLNQTFVKSNDYLPSLENNKSAIQYYYRMYLDSITKVDRQNKSELFRGFEYIDREDLPNRLSYNIDFWGGYNGSNNSKLIPKLNAIYNINGVDRNFIIDGANRKVDSTKSKNGTLNKVIFPTGGYTKYTYESNYADIRNLDKKYRMLLNPFNTNYHYFEKSNSVIYNNSQYKYRYKFNVPINSVGVEYEFFDSICENQINNFNCAYHFYVIPDQDNVEFAQPLAVISDLLPGNYILVVEPINEQESSNFSVKIKVNSEIFLDKLLVGGLRVKEIELNDLNKSIYKKYKYDYFNTNLTSGKIQTLPTYYKYYYSVKECKFSVNSDGIDLIQNLPIFVLETKSSPNIPLSDESGESIFYENVTEFEIDSSKVNEKGKTEYTFSYAPDVFYDTKDIEVSLPPISAKEKRGNLLSKNSYKKNNYGYQKITEELTDYSFDDYYSMNILPYRNFGGQNLSLNKYIEYSNNITVKYPSIITKNEYQENGSILKTINKVLYSNGNVISKKAIFPDSSVSETTYKYAQEKGNQYLIDKNMVGIPLQTTVTKTGNGITQTLSDVETKYPISQTDANTRTSSLPLPYEVLSKNFQGTANREVLYKNYDIKGNLQEYILKPDTNGNGTSVAIIWGYNQTQPIAKIEGAKYDDVKTLQVVLDAIAASNADALDPTKEADLIVALDRLRDESTLKGYQISTYTYDPLIGVTSITPVNGVREIYQYDSANRLEKVIDINGNILKENKYHYKQ